MTTMTANWTPSPAQVEFIRTLVVERVPANLVEDFWNYNVKQIKSGSVFSATVEDLKSRPKVVVAPVRPAYVAPVAPVVPPVLPALATEAGLYRNPADGTLYKVTFSKPKHSWDHPKPLVQECSNKVLVRRLTEDGEKVMKPTWKRFRQFESDRAVNYRHTEVKGLQPVTGLKVLASWLMTDEEKVEYRYGFCAFCYKPLWDGESVRRNYGPDCADNNGLPYNHSRKGLRVVES